MELHAIITLVVFAFVYGGMLLGRWPGLALDRTGIVVLGALVLVSAGVLGVEEAWASVDFPTMALLFGLMVLSAQFRLAGFYTWLTRWVGDLKAGAPLFLLQVMVLAGGLSAILANDIVCLAMAPVLVDLCRVRRLRVLPFLIGLACGSNIGSAATLIGNPQNMLIGQVLDLSFSGYLLMAIVPTSLSLIAGWGIVCMTTRGHWVATTPEGSESAESDSVPLERWQTAKAITVTILVVGLFLWGGIPREVVALGAAGTLLLSRRLASPRFLALVDWNLLLLFAGLFMVNEALLNTGLSQTGVDVLLGFGIDPESGAWLFMITAVLSNMVSNVPAVMLLLPYATGENFGIILALSSTLAGNLLLVGSIANIIVAEQAGRRGVVVSALEHARVGVPVTIASLAIAGLWLLIFL